MISGFDVAIQSYNLEKGFFDRAYYLAQVKRMKKRIIFIVCFGFLFTSCIKDSSQIILGSSYAFFAAGHTSGNPANWHRGFHAPFREKLHLIAQDSTIEFGFLLGDMVKKGSEENFRVLDEEIQLMNKTTHIVAGNHDVTDRALFDARYAPSFYAFRRHHDLFIVLDSNLDGWNISGKQQAFLKETLEANTSCVHIFIMVHHLLWWSRENIFRHVRINSSTGRSQEVNFYTEILPLLRNQKKPVFLFAGDVGAQATGSEFIYHRDDNVTYIATGMGGSQRDNFIIVDRPLAGSVQFRLIALNGDDISALGRLEDYRLPE